MKQTLVGILATIVIALGASWMSLNKRIDILEVQVQNDHDMLMQWNERHEGSQDERERHPYANHPAARPKSR
jgi:uncharacterized protein YxeA